MTEAYPSFDHRVALVRDPTDAADVTRQFLAAARDPDREFVIAVLREPVLDAVAGQLAGRVGRMLLTRAEQMLTESAVALLHLYDELVQDAIALGFAHVRIIGDPIWFADGRVRDWCTAERASNGLFDGWPVSALCLLDADAPPAVRAEFVSAHPRSADGTANPRFQPPSDHLRDLSYHEL